MFGTIQNPGHFEVEKLQVVVANRKEIVNELETKIIKTSNTENV